MNTTELTSTSLGRPLDLSSSAWGELRNSTELMDNHDALQARMREDGYLFLRGYLDTL